MSLTSGNTNILKSIDVNVENNKKKILKKGNKKEIKNYFKS
jgi:hypothetical protein